MVSGEMSSHLLDSVPVCVCAWKHRKERDIVVNTCVHTAGLSGPSDGGTWMCGYMAF